MFLHVGAYTVSKNEIYTARAVQLAVHLSTFQAFTPTPSLSNRIAIFTTCALIHYTAKLSEATVLTVYNHYTTKLLEATSLFRIPAQREHLLPTVRRRNVFRIT